MNNLETLIGGTPITELKAIAKINGVERSRIFAKLENRNLGGSIKDRVAKAIIDDAEKRGKLQKGGTVVEATSGNTGIGLALVAALRGYKAMIVMPETMSLERRKLIKAYGAEIVLTEGAKGMKGAVEKAIEIVENTPNSILADQFNNPVCVKAHYEQTAPELYGQMQSLNAKIDVFVAGVGTGGTLTGIGKYLKEKDSSIRIAAVEPKKSPLLSEGIAGAHGIQGIGANFVPTILDRTIYDEILTVDDEEAYETARVLCEKEGLFVGISAGAAVCAAIKLAKKEENVGKNIVTILPDEGGRYLSTPLFTL